MRRVISLPFQLQLAVFHRQRGVPDLRGEGEQVVGFGGCLFDVDPHFDGELVRCRQVQRVIDDRHGCAVALQQVPARGADDGGEVGVVEDGGRGGHRVVRLSFLGFGVR